MCQFNRDIWVYLQNIYVIMVYSKKKVIWYVILIQFGHVWQLNKTSILVDATKYIEELKHKVERLNEDGATAQTSSDQNGLPAVLNKLYIYIYIYNILPFFFFLSKWWGETKGSILSYYIFYSFPLNPPKFYSDIVSI